MTYTSGSPAPFNPAQAKLADRNWRWRNSWWIFAPIVGCGFFGFIGFLVAAIRTGKRHYWVATAAYAFAGVLSLTLVLVAGEKGTSRYDTLTGIAVIPFLIATFGPIIHAAIKNRDYLTTIAHKGTWYAQPQAPAAPTPQPTSFMGVSNSDYFAGNAPAAPSPASGMPAAPQPTPAPVQQPPTPPQPVAPTAPARTVDINSATAADLASALNIDQVLASHVVAVRDARGGYRNIDDLAAAATLQPHQLVRFRNKVTFGENPGQQNPPTGPGGRILDY